MKKLGNRMLIELLLFLSVGFTPTLGASNGALPVIQAPLSHLDEGVDTKLTAEQLKAIQPWAENTKSRLEELRYQTKALPKTQREEQLVNGLAQIVQSSSPTESETYMRFVLNRGLKLRQILYDESDLNKSSDIWMRLRLLESSVDLALSLYPETVNRPMPPSEFAAVYSDMLSGISKSVLDASAQYQVERLLLGFLQWDLYRDDNRNVYAVEIRRINNLFTTLPEVSPNLDQAGRAFVMQIKRLRVELRPKLPLYIAPKPDPQIPAPSDIGLKLKRIQHIAKRAYSYEEAVETFGIIETLAKHYGISIDQGIAAFLDIQVACGGQYYAVPARAHFANLLGLTKDFPFSTILAAFDLLRRDFSPTLVDTFANLKIVIQAAKKHSIGLIEAAEQFNVVLKQSGGFYYCDKARTHYKKILGL